MMTQRDQLNHRLYSTRNDLASELSVANIVDVPILDTAKAEDGRPVLGIIGNLKDYTIGADRGSNISMFDDFDIDFNQQKYLMETRCSGAITLPGSPSSPSWAQRPQKRDPAGTRFGPRWGRRLASRQ